MAVPAFLCGGGKACGMAMFWKWTVLAIAVVASWAGLCLGDGSEREPFRFGVLQSTDEHLARNREAGANIVVVELGWNRAEPAQSAFSDSYFRKMAKNIEARRRMGYAIALDLGFQYPPKWVFDLPHARYVNQVGRVFRSETTGEDIPNAVFNAAVRERQKAYLAEVFRRLGTEFALVRLGWMKYGELAYPVSEFGGRGNCYWAFDALAQGRAEGLAKGLAPCPVPGWVPGEASPDHARARAFLDWYLGALRNYHDWQIETTREFTSAPLAILYPSWGMRPGDAEKAIGADLSGATPAEASGEVQRGLDFERLVSGIRDPRVTVYCTWIDSSPEFGDDAADDPTRWSPCHYLAALASEHCPPLHVWGENTGGGDMATVALCFQRIRQYGYRGFLWAFEQDLYDGKKPEIGDFRTNLTGQ